MPSMQEALTFYPQGHINREWWGTPAILALQECRQEDQKLKVTLDFMSLRIT